MELSEFQLILQQVAVREAIVQTYITLKKYLNGINRKLSISDEDFINSYEFILNDALTWSGMIKPFGFYESKSTIEHYIDLDYYLTPEKHQFKKERPKKQLLDNLVNSSIENLVLFGKPGMGKTTSMKMLTQRIITEESFLENNFQIPIIIRLRELKNQFSESELKYNQHQLIFLFIYKLLNLRVSIIDDELEDNFKQVPVVKNLIIRVLENMRFVLILDGFDEIETEFRDSIISQSKEISLKCPSVKILITSRTGEFNYSIAGFDYFEIAPLSQEQIELFVSKWLDETKGNEFLKNLRKSTFSDTAMKPLILSFLCTIYNYNGELPNKPKFVYREVIDLLITKWDRERGFGRKSKFKGFDKSAKLDLIIHLAFGLVLKSKFKFTKHDLQVTYSDLCQTLELPKNSFDEVIAEIEEHSGLFIQSGVDSFEFPHKSLQEFLASEYLVRYSPLSDFTAKALNIPHELAIVVALSTNSNSKLIEILNLILDSYEQKFKVFLNIFLTRLESEEPNFKPDHNTARKLSHIWKKAFDLTGEDLYDFALRIYELNGISESYQLLDKSFKPDGLLVKSLMNGSAPPLDPELIKISSKSKDESIHVSFKFLENWVYISPYVKLNTQHNIKHATRNE